MPTCHNIIGLRIGICDRLSNHLTVILRTSPEYRNNMYDIDVARNNLDLNQWLCNNAMLCMSTTECNKSKMIIQTDLFIYIHIIGFTCPYPAFIITGVPRGGFTPLRPRCSRLHGPIEGRPWVTVRDEWRLTSKVWVIVSSQAIWWVVRDGVTLVVRNV